MKRILMSLMVAGLYVGISSAENEPIAAFGFTGDTKTVLLSTTPASPTQIMTRDKFVQRNWVICGSSFTVYISSFNTTISTTAIAGTSGTFSIPGANSPSATPWMWTPDGTNSVYQGAMWAISQPVETPQKISIFRSK